jgi:hypothetical protein
VIERAPEVVYRVTKEGAKARRHRSGFCYAPDDAARRNRLGDAVRPVVEECVGLGHEDAEMLVRARELDLNPFPVAVHARSIAASASGGSGLSLSMRRGTAAGRGRCSTVSPSESVAAPPHALKERMGSA